MNKHCFKVIFNKKRGQMMAVAETAIVAGKDTHSTGSAHTPSFLLSFKMMTFSLMFAAGAVLFLAPQLSDAAGIIGDKNAPGNQRPTVLQSANGTPQVNIQTPTKGGVSMNQYQQFNVDQKGAILNNSRQHVNTQIGGYVQGNPWLAGGEARVIVNQVNSHNPSALGGYVEVAGRRADVIIANPMGINVNGGGFINANAVTLTTGRPIIHDGQLTGINVNQGMINITGRGLDNRDVDYTRILSQAANINAGIWAKELKLIIGNNEIDAQEHITSTGKSSDAPQWGVDVGQLGGMYVGKITLIGTDKGVGVNNAGQIFASAGHISISADGLLQNTGAMVAQHASDASQATVDIKATGLKNSGSISSQGKQSVHTNTIENSGLMTTANELNIRNTGALNNQGTLNAGRIDIETASLHNQKGKIVQTGLQGLALDSDRLENINEGLIGYTPLEKETDPSNPSSGGSSGGTTEPTTPPSTGTAKGEIGIGSSSQAETTFANGSIQVKEALINDAGQITANGGIDLSAQNGLTNHATLNLNELKVSGQLLNNQAGVLTANQAQIKTDYVENQKGKITVQDKLNIETQRLNNQSGQLQSNNQIDIKAQTINNNESGLLAAKNNLNIDSQHIDNSNKGQIIANKQVQIRTKTLNNSASGSIDGQAIVLKTQQLDNQQGAIRSNSTLNAEIAKTLNNQGGQISAAKDLKIDTNGQGGLLEKIDNSQQGKIISGGHAQLSASTFNNRIGSIDAEAISIKAQQVDNQEGAIRSNSTLNAEIAKTLNNQSGQISAVKDIKIDTNGQDGLLEAIDNSQQGKIISGGQAQLNAVTFNNSTGGSVDGESIALKAQTVNNTQGVIRSNKKTALEVTDLIDNQGGQISSAGDIALHDANKNTLAINNNTGSILAGKNADIQSRSLLNSGSLAAGHDLDVRLVDDFSTAADIQAGNRLSLKTQGQLSNAHKLVGAQAVHIDAHGIDNTASGSILSEKETKLSAQNNIVNRGLINSNGLTLIEANNAVENIGTGKIYGNHIAIGANTLTNREETLNNETKAAVIAARERLDIGVKKLVNQEEGLIYTGNQLSIGGSLDANHLATGQAQTLINSSARIESVGDEKIAVDNLQNLNNHLKVEEYLDSSQKGIKEWAYNGGIERYREGRDGWMDRGRKSARFYFNDDRASLSGNQHNWQWWKYNQDTYRERVVESKPGEIIIGGHLIAEGNQWLNKDSHLIIGGTLTKENLGDLDNPETLGKQRIETQGSWGDYTYKRKGIGKKKLREKTQGPYNNTEKGTHKFEQEVMIFESNAQNVGGSQIDIAQSQAHINTVDTQSAEKSSGSQGSQVATIDAQAATSASGAKAAQIKTLSQFNTSLPNNSLFTINPNSGDYLIESDPKFTNYRQWLGSDYMLKMLATDPANIHKRLGDGYYEQRLINQQINQLTGYRRLAAYDNDEAQYKALMNAGVTFAQAYHLTPGIALTADQIARLTSDIVWLVNEQVTLANGETKTVLVPKVYLMVQEGDLNSSGALISANNMQLNLSGDLKNTGTIAGRRVVDLGAKNIDNGGLIQGAKVGLSAQEKMNVIGGSVVANDLLAIKAKEVNVASQTITSGNQDNGSTRIDRVAGLYLTNQDKGILSVDADGDINIKGAIIDNAAAEGTTLLASKKGDVNIGTVDVAKYETYGKVSDKNHYIAKQDGEAGSQIQARGQIAVSAGNKVNIRQSEINSDDASVVIHGSQGVDIVEGRQKLNSSASLYNKSSGFLSSTKTQDIYKREHDEAVGSNVTGQQVQITSDKDVLVRGSNIISDKGTYVKGQNVDITAAKNTHSENHFYDKKKKGFTASLSGGVASIGYGKSQNSVEQDGRSETLTVSQISSIDGNTTIKATHGDINAKAAVLDAGQDLTLIGKNVHLAADHIDSNQSTELKSKQSGFSVGLTYSPTVAGASTFKDNMKSNDFSNSIVGNAMKVGHAGAKAGMAAMTPIVIGINNKKVQRNQNSSDRQAVVSQLSAGDKLNIIATDGSIHSEGAKISAEGNALLHAKEDINLGFARNSHKEDASNSSKGFSFDNRDWIAPLGVHKEKGQGSGHVDGAVGTQLSVGGHSVMQTEKGDINILGSSVVAEKDNIINAARDVNIKSTQNSQSQRESHSSKAWGSAQISDTERFDGYMSSSNQFSGENIEQVRSQVGSLGGNVHIQAGRNYTQQVADVVAGKDLNITAKDIAVLEDHNSGSSHQSSKDLKVGVFSKVSSPLIDLANAVDTVRGSKADDRTQALQGLAAAGRGYMAYSTVKGVQEATAHNAKVVGDALKSGTSVNAEDLQQGPNLLKVEAGIGVKSAKSRQDNSYEQSQQNNLKAGGNINLTSTAGNIHLQNTNVEAHQGTTTLDSAKDILLEAGQSRQQAEGKSSSAGLSVGVGASVGAQTGVYIYAEAGANKSSNKTDANTHANTVIETNHLVLKSKGNTTLNGAEGRANRIDANVGGQLSVISPQDHLEQSSKQSGVGGRVQVSIGTAWEASGNFDQSKASGSQTTVNNQSGLFAGEGGYHINADSVDLKGGAIASTAPKERNELTTNQLTFSNIENKSDYSASSVSLSGGLTKGIGKPAEKVTGSPDFTPSLPMHETGSDSSTTYATLSPGQLTIGGKETSVEELGIHSDINTAHSKVKDLPNLEAVLEKQKAVAEATSTIAAATRTFSADRAKAADKVRQEAREQAESEIRSQGGWDAYDNLNEAEKIQALSKNKDYANADKEAQSWGIGGNSSRAMNAVTTAITGALGGQTNAQVMTNTLAPFASQLIGDQFGHGENKNAAAQLVSHFILGAVTAAVNDGNALAGGSAAVAGEAAAHYIIKNLPKEKYPGAIDPNTGEIDPNKLPEDAKALVRDLSGAIAAATGGIAGDSATSAQLGGVAGVNAVENNSMALDHIYEREQELRDTALLFGGDKEKAQAYINAKNIAQVKGAGDTVIDTVKGLIETVKHPIDTIVGIYDTLTNLDKVYDSVKVSVTEWNDLYGNALKNDPALAGEMAGYFEGQVGTNLSTGFVASGSGIKILQKAAKLKNSSQITKKVPIEKVDVGKLNLNNLPKTMIELNNDLLSKGFKFMKKSEGGYTRYKHPDGRIVTIKPTGEVIPTKPKVAQNGKKYNERTDYEFNRLIDQSHSTGHFIKKDK